MHFLRMLDFQSAQRPKYFLANSKEVAARIQKFYRRDAVVIYPPVDVSSGLAVSKKYPKENFYLTGGRLSRHKGMDIAVKAATKLRFPLKVFGGGFASYGEGQLRAMAGKNVEFLGEITDSQKWELMAKARAFLFPSEQEDFGIVPVEAMSAGTPVIALGQGGVLETVVDAKTGVLFSERSTESLAGAIKRFEKMKILSEACIKQAQKFSKERFKREIREFVKLKIKS
jgi:glycosyltransferase involved in cell wall biosynthesis